MADTTGGKADETAPGGRYPIHAAKIDTFTVTPAVMAGGDHVSVQWATRGASRLELWLDGRPWLCPLTANGSRRIAVRRSTEFRLIAGPSRGPWIEHYASVMMISLPLFVATIVLTTLAIASLWWASEGFLSDVSLIESTPVWRTVGATSRVASFVTTLVGLPVIGSLLRLWPGATSSFGVRLLRHRPVAIAWIASCLFAISCVLSLWRSTETVILSSEVSATVHFLEPGKDSVALAVPPGVSTAIISRDGGGMLGWLIGPGSGTNILSGGNRTLPHRVYAERQGEFWILGCWSEVLVRSPPGFQATVELPDGQTVPVDLTEDEDGLSSDLPRAHALSVMSRRARIPVRDCKSFPTTATLVVRDSVGTAALRLPFPLNLPPARDQWAAARQNLRRSVQADIELGIVSMPHDFDEPTDVAVELAGEDGWHAAQCGRIDANVGSVFVAVAADRSRLEPPLAPPGSASENAADATKLQARCADPPGARYRFLVPLRVNGRTITRAQGCAYPASVADPDAPNLSRCVGDTELPWSTTFAFGMSGEPPRLGRLDVCAPTTWDGHHAQLVERQSLRVDDARSPSRWRGTLEAGTHPIVWPATHWAPGKAEIVRAGSAPDNPEVLDVSQAHARSPEDTVRIADRTLSFTATPTWRDRVAESVGVVTQPQLLFDDEDAARTCAWTDAAEVVVERTTDRAVKLAVTGFPSALANETIDAHVELGRRRLECFVRASRPTVTCLR